MPLSPKPAKLGASLLSFDVLRVWVRRPDMCRIACARVCAVCRAPFSALRGWCGGRLCPRCLLRHAGAGATKCLPCTRDNDACPVGDAA
jgi:hypothetical protein